MFSDEINLFKEMAECPAPIPGMRPAHLYPSSASVKVTNAQGATKIYGGCARQQVLRYIGEPHSDTHTDNETLGVWLAGNHLQDIIEARWKQAGVFVQSELPVYFPQYNVSGRVDTILHKVQPDGRDKLFGVEIKSKAGYWAETHYINPNRGTPDNEFRPADEHLLQSMVYMHAFNTLPQLTKFKIDKWLIAYILRDNYNFNYFEVQLTDDTYNKGYGYPIIYSKIKPQGFIYSRFNVKDITNRWDEINAHIKAGTLPPRDYVNIYSNTELQIMSKNGEMSKTNTDHISKGDFHKVVQTTHGQKESLGDKACCYCEYRSKCWGLGQHSEESFTEIKP